MPAARPSPERHRRLTLVALAFLCAAPGDGRADAPAVESALAAFRAAYTAGRFAEAQANAESALAAGGGAEALEGVAIAALHQGRIDRAYRAYEEIVADAAAPVDVRSRAQRQLAALEVQTGRVVWPEGPEGVEVLVEGQTAAYLPAPRAFRALPGRLRIRYEREGAPLGEHVVVVSARQTVRPPPPKRLGPVHETAEAGAPPRPELSPSQRVVLGPPPPSAAAAPSAPLPAPLTPAEHRRAVEVVMTAWASPAHGKPWYVEDPVLCRQRCAEPALCPENLWALLSLTCDREDARLGLDAFDRDYYYQHAARFGGRMMRIPEDLIRASIEHPVVSDFKAALRTLGYRHMEFASTSVPNPPGGFWRVLVLVESPDYDQWFQIAANDGPPRTLSRNIDFAVVQKRDEAGTALEPNPLYLSGYSRRPEDGGRWEHEGLGSDHLLNRCVMCHPSGLRSITPVAGSVAPEELDTLAYVQKKLDTAALTSFDGFHDPARRGPVMGRVDPPTRPDVLRRCAAARLPAPARARVSEAMNCASCHDGRIRGILDATTEPRQIEHKIIDAPLAARMPPPHDVTLTEAEARAVADCLRAEYQAELRAWLFAGRD